MLIRTQGKDALIMLDQVKAIGVVEYPLLKNRWTIDADSHILGQYKTEADAMAVLEEEYGLADRYDAEEIKKEVEAVEE